MFIIFLDILIDEQIFFSPQVKRNVIISNEHCIYESPHKLPNDSSPRPQCPHKKKNKKTQHLRIPTAFSPLEGSPCPNKKKKTQHLRKMPTAFSPLGGFLYPHKKKKKKNLASQEEDQSCSQNESVVNISKKLLRKRN